MQRIAVDMDGVLADVVDRFLDWDERDHGVRQTIEQLSGKTEAEAFPLVRKYVYTASFFRGLRVMPDSREVLEQLNRRYDVFIVSAATEFPQSLPEKQEWLSEHFPFITWQQVVFCGSKKIIHADIMIDDHFKNLDHFSGHSSLLFTQPHNVMADPGKHRRVHSWLEIAAILL